MARTHVALLRGINVGKAKRVAMADLRKLLEGLGYSDVQTLLNSGNIVFTATGTGDPAARIEKAIASELGVTSRVTVLTGAELKSILARNPLAKVAKDPSRMLVSVPNDKSALGKLKPLLKQDWAPEAIALGSRAAYVWCSDGINTSKVGEAVGRALGDGVTSRNWKTMEKLHELVTR